MKKLLFLFSLLLPISCFSLGLSKDGVKESKFFNDYLSFISCEQGQDKDSCFNKIEELLKKEPNSKELKKQLVNLAVELGDLEKASTAIDFVNIDEANNTEEDFELVSMYYSKQGDQTGDYSKAIYYLEKALELNPDEPRLLVLYMWHLLKTDRQKLQQVLKSQEKINPLVVADIYAQIGNLYLQVNEVQNAYNSFQKSLQLDSQNIRAKLGLVDVYEKAGKYFLMLHELEDLERAGYQEASFYARLGAVFVLVNDLEKAEKYFLKAKELDNSSVQANYFLSLFAEKRQDYEAAISYQKESANYSTVASKWVQVSYYLDRLGKHEEGLRELKMATQKFPDDKEVAFYYAVALQDAQKFAQSAKILRRLIKERPDHIQSRLYYAYALDSLGKYKELEEQLSIILINKPDEAAALNLFAYTLAERGERLEQANEYIARALAVKPQEYAYQDTQAWIYFKMGKYEKALLLLNPMSERTLQENPEIAYHLGAIYEKLGNITLAKKYLEMAKDVWPAAKKLLKKIEKK